VSGKIDTHLGKKTILRKPSEKEERRRREGEEKERVGTADSTG
jgi:hypothetical protein